MSTSDNRNEDAGRADRTEDRSMRALLLDEEAGDVEHVADRPLRLLREEEEADTGAAPPRPGAPGAGDKSASQATSPLNDSVARRPPAVAPTPAAQVPNDGASRRLSMAPASAGAAQGPGASPDKAPAPPASAAERAGAPSASGTAASTAPGRVPPPRGAPPAGGEQAAGGAVIPGVGPLSGAHVGATVGLVNGVVSHVVGSKRPTRDAKQSEIATSAQHDPSRCAPDLLLYTHNRKRYEELARARRLPSQAWAEYEANGQLDRHLRAVHERYGEQLRNLYRDRPMAERTILGLAAATGTSDDLVRALDALRVHPHYPARASFARLVDGFTAPEIARIAAAFLPGGSPESVVEVYRAVREARERAHVERRRRLLRLLRAQWAMEQPAMVPLFEAITRGFSPAQVALLRAELERSGEVEAVFEQIEAENLRRRLDAVEASFRRWLGEWEASRPPTVQTPMQEPFVLADVMPPRPSALPAEPPTAIDSDDDGERQLTLQRTPEVLDVPAPAVDAEDDGADDAQGLGDEAGAPYAIYAPPPGAYAADGVLPWRYLTHGFGRIEEERLRRAWEAGRQWDVYRAILHRRGAARMAAREAAFLRYLEGLGCSLPGPCRIGRAQLAVLAPLGAGFTPEQWARLAAALTEGLIDPLDIWREIERENLAEAISVREAAFLRHMGAWGHAPYWNPLEWTRVAPRLGRVLLDQETSGLIDDLGGALGSLGGADGGDALSTLSQGIGALFGGGGGGGAPQGGSSPVGGKLGAFAEEAIGILTGRKTPTRPKAGPGRGEPEAAGPVDGGETADVLSVIDQGLGAVLGADGAPGTNGADMGARLGGLAQQALGGLAGPREPGAAPPSALDVQRVLAQWVGQGRFGERVVRGLEGVGLTDLAAAVPQELLRVTAGRLPSQTDPSGWWQELTTGQGLSEEAEALLRRTIDANGPDGIAQTVATYTRLLEDAARAQKAEREAMFVKILAAAQRVAGPAFDPARLPGGDPFVLLGRNVRGWPRVVEAMKRGENPLGVFRQIEDERLTRLLRVDAPAWMNRMLAALWTQRDEAGWAPGGDVGEPEAAGAGGDDVGDADEGEAGDAMQGEAGDPDAGDVAREDAGYPAGDAGDADDAGDPAEDDAGDAEDAGDFDGDVGDAEDAGDVEEAAYADAGYADPRAARPQGAPPGREGPPRPPPGREGPPRPPPGYDAPLTRPRVEREPGRVIREPVVVREPGRVIREPVVVREPGRVIREPVIVREPGRVIREPVVVREPGRVIREPVIVREPGRVIREPVVVREPGRVIREPVIVREPGRVIREPVVVREPGRAIREPVVVREPGRVIREPVVVREPGRVIREPVREIVRAPIGYERRRYHDPFRDLWWRRPDRGFVPGPVPPFVPPPLRRILWNDAYSMPVRWPFMRHWRPRPLYHLSFARPMSERELRRLLMFVPQLRAHPDGVLAEMAGLVGQARDVRGVDATTGEYLLLPGETLMDIAFKLVGDRRRWRELLVANPLRAEGDPRVRIPPSWFGYVPYSIPLRRVHEMLALRRRLALARRFETGEPEDVALDDAGDVDEAAFDDAGEVNEAALYEAGDVDEAASYEAGGADEAGAPWNRRARRAAWRRMRRPRWVGSPGGMVVAERHAEEEREEPEGEDAGDPDLDALRRYIVMRSDLRAPGTPDHTRAVAEAIALRHGLWDGERWLRGNWWAELRDANPQKPLDPRGWWRAIGQGEELSIPASWPIVRQRFAPDGSEASGPVAGGAPQRYVVTRSDVRSPQSPDHTREAAEAIATRHGLWDGERWWRPRWWQELRDANSQKPIRADGWWRDIAEGELLWIPAGWPVIKQRSVGGSDTGDIWEDLAQFLPGSTMARGGRGAPSPDDSSQEPPEADPRFSRDPRNRGRRPNLTAQVYAVVRGDWPQKIARKFGADRRRHWLTELERVNPHKPIDSGTGNWFTLATGEFINIPDAWVGSETGWLDDSDAGAPRENLTTRTYSVVAGDGMQRIAQKLGAASRARWFGELRDANPHKKMLLDDKGRQLRWVSLDPGEIINIPDAWPDTPQLRPPPGGTPTPAPHQGLQQYPTFQGGAVPSPTAPPGTVPAAASVDPGLNLRVQGLLAAFGRLYPEAIVPRDFGTGTRFSPDALSVLTPRTQQALASFQRWTNATTGSRLRTDGVLDPDTIAALDSFSAQVLGGLEQRPAPTPAAGATPTPGDARDPFAGQFKAPSAPPGMRPGDVPEPPPRAPAPAPPRRPAPMPPPVRVPPVRVPPMPPVQESPEPVLNDLQETLQQYGAPGVPGYPGGAPHAPRPRRPPVAPPPPPEVPRDDLPPEAPPAPPEPAAKKGDDPVVPMVLTGLGILSGIFG
jgi:hypothetical protein